MKYLHADPKIMGGRLVIKGTRIPVEVILHHMGNNYTLEEIHEMWSYVDLKTLKGAIKEAADILSRQPDAKTVL